MLPSKTENQEQSDKRSALETYYSTYKETKP